MSPPSTFALAISGTLPTMSIHPRHFSLLFALLLAGGQWLSAMSTGPVETADEHPAAILQIGDGDAIESAEYAKYPSPSEELNEGLLTETTEEEASEDAEEAFAKTGPDIGQACGSCLVPRHTPDFHQFRHCRLASWHADERTACPRYVLHRALRI